MSDVLDTKLKILANAPVNANRLKHLESDVWQHIAARKIDTPTQWYERILAAIFAPQYRLAPMAMSGIMGITLGIAMFGLPAPKEVAAAEALNFHVFSSQSSYLVSSNLSRNLL